MSSSGDDGGSGYFPGMFGAASPMPGLPVAGKDNVVGDPYQYGKFQNFLPDIKAEGRNDSATGLRPDMFTYRGPNGVTAPGPGGGPAAPAAAGGGGDTAGLTSQIQGLRDQLAMLQASSMSNNQQLPIGGINRTTPGDTWTNAS